jgi:hypothetical protein
MSVWGRGVPVCNISVYTFSLKRIGLTKPIFDNYDDDKNASLFSHDNATCLPEICISLTFFAK